MNLTGYSRDTALSRSVPQYAEHAYSWDGRCRARTCDPLRVKQPKPPPPQATRAYFHPLFAGETSGNGHTKPGERHGHKDAVFGGSRDIHGMNA